MKAAHSRIDDPTRRRSATDPRRWDTGLTLVEVLVALALFAVISAAGFSVLDQLIRVQSGTDGRLDRLAQIQRAVHLVTQDFSQVSGGSLGFADGAVSFRRGAGRGELAVRYGLEGGEFTRALSDGLAQETAKQVLLPAVEALEWRFLDEEGAWSDTWPVEAERDPANPLAVSLALTLTGPVLAGQLRRIVILPAEFR